MKIPVEFIEAPRKYLTGAEKTLVKDAERAIQHEKAEIAAATAAFVAPAGFVLGLNASKEKGWNA